MIIITERVLFRIFYNKRRFLAAPYCVCLCCLRLCARETSLDSLVTQYIEKRATCVCLFHELSRFIVTNNDASAQFTARRHQLTSFPGK